MSLRFFSDHCVPAQITDLLRGQGHQVTLLREVLPFRSADSLVICPANRLRAVVTLIVTVWGTPARRFSRGLRVWGE
jgi:hypothetical protein